MYGNSNATLLWINDISSTIDPVAEILVTKTFTGVAPKFSGDAVNYIVTLQNI